jgi:nickel/cobalt exporter
LLEANHGHGHDHDHDHDHDHGHHRHAEESRRIDTGHGIVALEVFENGLPPRWRLRTVSGHAWRHADVTVVTERLGQERQAFAFVDRGDYLESVDEIPEPHEFTARLSLGHGGHTHDYELYFAEHVHGHPEGAPTGLKVGHEGDFMDAHERAHAADITRRFGGRNVTNSQILLFGLTGGLIPCPAAITVLLLCLQLKQITLGVMLVLFFSVGLALTMVSAGVLASLSVKHISTRWSGFSTFARRAPYASGGLMLVIAFYMGVSGWVSLS